MQRKIRHSPIFLKCSDNDCTLLAYIFYIDKHKNHNVLCIQINELSYINNRLFHDVIV